MRRYLLDVFCGAGGATRGYQRAGFHVTGVDIHLQPNYCGDDFAQGDALDFIRDYGGYFEGIHASPPCQAWSRMSNCRVGLSDTYPQLISQARQLLEETGLPWVIENVVGSQLVDPITLCGQMFGLELYRHRLFEGSFPLTAPPHPEHVIPASKAGHWTPGTIMSVAGHVAPVAKAREVMGIDWTTRDELAEAVPPAYTEHVGLQLMARVAERAA